jgi:predicted RNA binding protein YcfA (HicA-like mRNA interferase family)
MSDRSATKASVVLAVLVRNGWQIVRQRGSDRVLAREGSANYVFAFHDREELSPRILARIAKHTGLKPEDL